MWWGDPDENHGSATLEGGDVMPIGNGNVLIGMSERTSRQAITQLAAALFAKGAAKRVIVAGMPKLRAAMHLDTVFTFCDRDVVTLFPEIVDRIVTFSLRPADKPTGVELTPGEQAVRRGGGGVAGPARSCAWWRPAAMPTPRSASSGTAATTWWPLAPGVVCRL